MSSPRKMRPVGVLNTPQSAAAFNLVESTEDDAEVTPMKVGER